MPDVGFFVLGLQKVIWSIHEQDLQRNADVQVQNNYEAFRPKGVDEQSSPNAHQPYGLRRWR